MKTVQENLQDAFALIESNHTNRSSAVFPVFVTEHADTRLVFMNYWDLKNNNSDVSVNFRVYDEDGNRLKMLSTTLSNPHYDLSMREMLDGRVGAGMVEMEIVSTKNLRIPFPAVTALYTGREGISAVHTAGRVKNLEEPSIPTEVRETNWTCKFGPDVTPFFFVFNGPNTRPGYDVRVAVHGEDGEVLATTTFQPPVTAPFSSRLLYLDELFDQDFPDGSFAEVATVAAGTFPRMVVGNFFRDLDFHEVTHSFEWQQDEHYSAFPDGVTDGYLSISPVAKHPELDLRLTFFPTNWEGEFIGVERTASFGDGLAESGGTLTMRTGGPGAPVVNKTVGDDVDVYSLDVVEGLVPSRVNTSYVYSVKGSDAPFSTDIPSGLQSCVVPLKGSFWGPAIIGGGFDTMLYIFNVASLSQDRGPNRGHLRLIGQGGELREVALEFEPESCLAVSVNDLLAGLDVDGETVSWLLKMERRVARDVFWVAHNEGGEITGDHCF